MPTLRPLPLAAIAAVLLVLGACGGSGGGGGGGGNTGPQVSVSGTATYADVPATAGGLDYAATSTKPIRGAVVEARGSGGTPVYSRSNTDAAGAYTVTAPENQAIQIVVLSALGNPSNADTRVVNASDATYGITLAHSTSATASTGVNLHAPSGWGGSSYTATRAAAPFAILDTIYECRQLVLGAAPSASFPPVRVKWSASTTPPTSFFSPGDDSITILGIANSDTDEYDDGVVAHEWGHYFEHHFSRSDSLGGPHGGGDILDETVAFGEGFGNAFSCIVRNDPFYIDTMGAGQGNVGVLMNVEADSISDSANVGGRLRDGSWGEATVQELLWDIYDGVDGAEGDQVSLGWAPMQAVLTGPQKTTASFTSIHSFLHHLKARPESDATSDAAIVALAAAENIGAHDEFEQTSAGRRRYTSVPNNGSTVSVDVDGTSLATRETYGDIDPDYMGNRLYNRLFFTVTAPAGGTLRIRVIPSGGSNDVGILLPGGSGRDDFYAGTETLDLPVAAGTLVAFSVISFDVQPPGAEAGGVPFTVRCGTPATVTKPAPTMPEGNG